MATQDDGSGLLSKVAKFVRHPATDWVELDKVPVSEPAENSKQALRHMIERKAHNDAVRRREFSQLRKVRQAAQGGAPELVLRQSSFRDSSGFSDLQERAETLKKIDEIEAQMSKQWWKGRKGAEPPASKDLLSAGDAPYQAGLVKPLAIEDSAFAATTPTNLVEGESVDDVPTQMGMVVDSEVNSSTLPGDPEGAGKNFDITGSSAFSASKMVSVEMGQNLSDPTLEEAAIRFANSDDEGAEAVLLTALQSSDATPESTEIWMQALFDLYRSTGQQANFERAALDYARRAGRSAPIWFSTPHALGPLQAIEVPLAPAPVAPPEGRDAWACPEVLDVATVTRLADLVVLGRGAVVLNWQALREIEPAAGFVLAGLMARWCDQALSLHFDGVEAVSQVLQTQTPVGDDRVEEYWWHMRLNSLRILRLQEDFENVAMDYCITFEVSPPAWQPAKCLRVFGQEAPTELMDWDMDEVPVSVSPALPLGQGYAAASPGSEAPAAHLLELVGEILGDAEQALAPLKDGARPGSALTVSCTRLIRVDFSAAGSILNWVADAQQQNVQVTLRDVPHLVAAFFNLIGINEHARIAARTR